MGKNYTFLKFKSGGEKVPTVTKKQRPRGHCQMSSFDPHENFCYNFAILKFEKNFEYALISVHYNISNIQIFGAPSSTAAVDKVCFHWFLCRKCSPTQLSFKIFFNIIDIFCSFQPLSNAGFVDFM